MTSTDAVAVAAETSHCCFWVQAKVAERPVCVTAPSGVHERRGLGSWNVDPANEMSSPDPLLSARECECASLGL